MLGICNVWIKWRSSGFKFKSGQGGEPPTLHFRLPNLIALG
ncbi:MAG: hypothetical protein ACFNNL_05195 [Kingella oralis]